MRIWKRGEPKTQRLFLLISVKIMDYDFQSRNFITGRGRFTGNIWIYCLWTFVARKCHKAAGKQLEKQILNLNEIPERFPKYGKEPWYSRGLRFATVDNYYHVLHFWYGQRHCNGSPCHVQRTQYWKTANCPYEVIENFIPHTLRRSVNYDRPLFATAMSQSPGLPETLATAHNPEICLLALPVILYSNLRPARLKTCQKK